MATLNIYTKFRYQKLRGDTVVETGSAYVVLRPGDPTDCDTIDDLFNNLTVNEALTLLARATVNAPQTPEGYKVIVYSCADDSLIEVRGDNSGDPYTVTTGDGFDTTYVFTRAAGTDFKGTPFVLTPAPILVPTTKTKPRLTGNNYNFTPQTALNTAVFKRFPKTTTHSSKIIIYPGGLYLDNADNDLIGRLFTHVAESTKMMGSVYPTDLPRAIEMANYKAAFDAASDPSATSAQRTKLLAWAGPLPAFEGNHLFIDDEETCQLYAKYWWKTFKQADWKGAGINYFSVNHEAWVQRDGTAYNYVQQWYRQVGWITKAIIAYAAADGVDLKSAMTDFGNLGPANPYFFDTIDGTLGRPEYMTLNRVNEPYRGGSQSVPLGGNTDMGALVLAGHAFVGTGRYFNFTSDGQSLFEKNPDGTLKVVDGNPVWRTDKRRATLSGQDTVIYMDDNYMAMLHRYALQASDYTNWYLRAGSVDLPMSNTRATGLTNVRFANQYRLDTQIDTSNSQLAPGFNGLTQEEFNMLNSRPLYPNWTEGNAIRMYMNSDYIRGWMESQQQTAMGADNGNSSKARAIVEIYMKGFHRATQLNWLFDTTYQLCVPKYWLKNQGAVSAPDNDEHFARKPILEIKLAAASTAPRIALTGEWPCQDEDKTTDVLIWIDKGSGAVTGSYKIQLRGREPIVEDWFLPAEAIGLEPKHIYAQFNSLLGEKITWRFDYREAKITSHPTPPTLA